jgi:hypothetical protein
MNAFEQLIAEILWQKGFWVQTSAKVALTKEEKRQIGLPSAPRWEIDIVAYSGKDNLITAIECKSYLDSQGVTADALIQGDHRYAKRFKLFHDANLRTVVLNRLASQLVESGACAAAPTVKFGLAYGKLAREADRNRIVDHFAKNGWDLYDEHWVRAELKAMAGRQYENQISSVVAKLLLRQKG